VEVGSWNIEGRRWKLEVGSWNIEGRRWEKQELEGGRWKVGRQFIIYHLPFVIFRDGIKDFVGYGRWKMCEVRPLT